jgi:ribosome biogenesis GTPase
MSKRHITQQQRQRIEHSPAPEQIQDGLVITRFGKQAEIQRADGGHQHCTLRPHLTDVVAGDRIGWQPSTEALGVITHVYPRDSELARVTPRGVKKTIAANITQLAIVVATQPEIAWDLLDSYLVMAELLAINACIVFNKSDIQPWTQYAQLQAIYAPLHYPIIVTSIRQTAGTQALAAQLAQHTTVFVGQSGVGKSSLIKHLLPHEQSIQTGALSTHTALGRHTTSSTTWYPIPTGGALIDSPGIREFSLAHLGTQPIPQGFREFRPYLGQCKFRNCEHLTSPGCAILAAINNHLISPSRHKSYARMIECS